jgi:hypothetical protein
MTLTVNPVFAASKVATVVETKWEEGQAPRFNAKDRCDKCGAQAYVKVGFTSGSSLLFCSHDANEQRPKMLSKGVVQTWYSETGRLVENRKQGSEN